MQVITLTTPAIFSSPEDELACVKFLEAERDAWNRCSEKRFALGKNDIKKLHASFYRNFRNERPEIPAQVLIIAQRACLASYKSAKSCKHKITKPHIKKNLSAQLDIRLYAKKGFGFKMTTLGKRIVLQPYIYKRFSEFIEKYEWSSPLVFVKNEIVMISYSFKIPCAIKEGDVLGLDLGCRHFITTSDGKLIGDKKYNSCKRKVRYLKRRLQSKGTRSAKRKLKQLRRKEQNQTRDFVHRVTKFVLRLPIQTFVIEDLKGIKSEKRHKGAKNRVSQIPFALFKEIFTYKARLLGKHVITVNPMYTSQIDHRNGRKTGIRQGRRYYGHDGIVLDADVNAAINIAYKYVHVNANDKDPKHPVSRSMALDGQAAVVRPIAQPWASLLDKQLSK